MYEIRVVVDSVVKEACETSELPPPTPTHYEADVHGSEVEVTNVGNTSKADVVMTQQSQITPHDSVSPTPNLSFDMPQNLAEPIVVVAVNTFAEVSQVAEEVVMNATH